MRVTRKPATGHKARRDLFAELAEGMTALAGERTGKRSLRSHRHTMNKAKMKKLESRGWKFGNAADFLKLTAEGARGSERNHGSRNNGLSRRLVSLVGNKNLAAVPSALIELKLKLAHDLAARRKRQHYTQVSLAKLLKSSQSRIAKMESGDPSVSIDLLVRSLLSLGASSRDLARAIA